MGRPAVVARPDVSPRKVALSVYPSSYRLSAALIAATIFLAYNFDGDDIVGLCEGICLVKKRHRRRACRKKSDGQCKNGRSDQIPPSLFRIAGPDYGD